MITAFLSLSARICSISRFLVHVNRYVKHREPVILAARIGYQLSAMLYWSCTAALHSSTARAASGDWAALMLGDALAGIFQMVHLPVGFQVPHRRPSSRRRPMQAFAGHIAGCSSTVDGQRHSRCTLV
jgi:hypothetical protein